MIEDVLAFVFMLHNHEYSKPCIPYVEFNVQDFAILF